MELGPPTDDPARVRQHLGLADPSDGGSPAALIRRLLQLTEYARLRSHSEAELLEIAAALGSVEAWAAAAQRDAPPRCRLAAAGSTRGGQGGWR